MSDRVRAFRQQLSRKGNGHERLVLMASYIVTLLRFLLKRNRLNTTGYLGSRGEVIFKIK